jgi:hypothetical protein
MKYNVSELFQSAFGIRVEKAYALPAQEDNPNMPQLNYSGIQVVQNPDQAKQMSAVGTPILFPITFKGSEYMEYDLEGKIRQKVMGDFRLPMTSIAEFRRAKIIGKTRAVAGSGTNKETYGFDDWKVTIRGFLLQEANHPQAKITPYQQEEELLQWENLCDAIKVESDFFQMRNIHRIVIKEMPIQTLRGKPGIRPFIITAESDTPIELIL